MKYFDFLYEVVGYDSIIKGRIYPSFLIEYSDKQEIDDGFIHYFDVLASRNGKDEEVEIKNNGELIFEASCSCSKFKKNQTCEHIAACLLNYRGNIILSKKIDLYKESQDILNYFYKENEKPTIKQKAKLLIDILFYYNEVTYRLHVGASKCYVLNTKAKFDKFIDVYKNGGKYTLGAKFEYDSSKYYFDEEDRALLDYLASFERDNSNSNSNVFHLFQRDFEYILEKVKMEKIKINGCFLKNIVRDVPFDFKLNLNKANDYELKVNLDPDMYVLLPNYKYILYHCVLYILPEEYQKILMELGQRKIDSLVFNKESLNKFNHGILRSIRDKVEVDKKIQDIKIDVKPEIALYFDIERTLRCKIDLTYGTQKVDIFGDDKDILRDLKREEEVLQDLVNQRFVIKNKQIKMTEIDDIGYFLEEGINVLNQKYTIYTSKKFQDTNLIKQSRVKKNFSIGTDGILSFDFSVDNIDMNELKGIFLALKNKKTYHKLKNGSLINLEENTEIQKLNKITEDLNLNYDELSENIKIPKYRALYIDSLKNEDSDIETNNLFDEFINNFKTYQNVSINFSKDDNKILRNYQKLGVKFLYTIYKCDLGGILADEMGLGKSLETICFLKEVIKNKKDAKVLIVCPTSLVYNWEKEFIKFGKDLKYTVIGDNKQKRLDKLKQDEANILITSYGLLRNDLEVYKDKNFEVCIIDEAQYIKNYQAQMTKALKQINARTKIALTGTPIENSVTELWSIFDFLMPGYLNNIQKFQEKYHISDLQEEDMKKLESLNKQIKPFILRRKKNDVVKDLPDKVENNVYLEFDDEQKKLYLSVLKETQREIEEEVEREGFKKARFKILMLLTRLRQICIEPRVVYENYEGTSIKIEKLLEMIKSYAKDGHKMLVFSSFKKILDLVKLRLAQENISFYSIDGGVVGKERVALVDKFNNDKTTCFLITLKAGGTGLNLTSADIVIHLDIWWNPQAENQATDRTHRIGQTKKVIVNKLITKGTIEERILELQKKKQALSDNLIEGNTNTDVLGSLSEEELRELLTFNQN